MSGRSVKSRITSEIFEQFCVEKILLTCRTGKKKKQKICKIQINKWLPKCCCCFLFIVAASLTSPCGTKGVICCVLIYLFFEQDENKTQQIEEQNLTKVIIWEGLHHQVSSFLLNVLSRNVLILAANIFRLQNALCKIHPHVTIDATLVSSLVSIILFLYWLQAIFLLNSFFQKLFRSSWLPQVWGTVWLIKIILFFAGTWGACNPNHQVFIMHALHVCSQHSCGLPLRMSWMHWTQFDHTHWDLLSLVIWSHLFWLSVTWNFCKAERRLFVVAHTL